MVVLVLRAVEGDRRSGLHGVGEGRLVGGSPCCALQESGVEVAAGLASSTGTASSGSHGMVLGRSAIADRKGDVGHTPATQMNWTVSPTAAVMSAGEKTRWPPVPT